ncbi:hypothetical protein Tco_0597900 [Tanacetum coccineum]
MKYDHIPHNEKSIKLLLAEEKFLKIKQVVEEEQTQPEYLQELLQSLLEDLQILNEIQPLKQEISNQIQKDQEEKSTVELRAEGRLQKANQALNESQSSQEMRIQDLEIQKQRKSHKKQKNLESLKLELELLSDDSILRGIESDRDSGEDTTSIDDLPLDDSMILPGENDVLDEEEDTFTFTTRTFLPFVTYHKFLPSLTPLVLIVGESSEEKLGWGRNKGLKLWNVGIKVRRHSSLGTRPSDRVATNGTLDSGLL